MAEYTASYWIEKIQKEERCHDGWRKAALLSEDDYFDTRSDTRKHLYNVHFSTVNSIHSRIYSRNPTPDVRRRFEASGNDPFAAASKNAAQLIERAISYTLDTSDFGPNANRIVRDFLVTGLGVPWIEYDTIVDVDDQGLPSIRLQKVSLRHVTWSRFHWEPGKDWEDVDWVARDHYLTADEIKAQFEKDVPEKGSSKKDEAQRRDESKSYATTYRVTEVWHRPTRMIYVVGWDFDELLESRRDALGLQGFYPCPRPMLANVKSHSLDPRPDHTFFASSYDYLNRIVSRIHKITAQIKSVGFYDAGLPELSRLASASDGDYIPIANLAERLNTAGSASAFDRVIADMPLASRAAVLRQLQELLAVEKQRLDEQTGIADIIQGSTDPNETAKAQSIKASYANIRLSSKMEEVSRCFRDVMRIMGEIIAEHFTAESLYLSSGIQPDQQVMAVLKTDVGRNLSIDIETDSTVAIDDEHEKRQRLEFLNYFTPFVQNVAPMIHSGQLPADLATGILRFAVGSFKHGRALEEVIESLPTTGAQLQTLSGKLEQASVSAQQMQAQMQQMAQQMQALQQQVAQFDAAKSQADAMKSQAAVIGAQTAQMKAVNDAQQSQIKTEIEAYKAQTDRASLASGASVVSVM